MGACPAPANTSPVAETGLLAVSSCDADFQSVDDACAHSAGNPTQYIDCFRGQLSDQGVFGQDHDNDDECDIEEVVDHVYKVMEACKEGSYDKVTRSKTKWKELDEEVEISNYSKQLSKEVTKDRMKYKYNAKLRTYAARKRLLMEKRGDAPFALQKEDGSMAVTYE